MVKQQTNRSQTAAAPISLRIAFQREKSEPVTTRHRSQALPAWRWGTHDPPRRTAHRPPAPHRAQHARTGSPSPGRRPPAPPPHAPSRSRRRELHAECMLTDGDRCESCAGARRAVRMASQRKDRARMTACCAGCSASRHGAASRLRAPCRLSASLRPTPRTAQSASRRSGQRAQQALPCCATESTNRHVKDSRIRQCGHKHSSAALLQAGRRSRADEPLPLPALSRTKWS